MLEIGAEIQIENAPRVSGLHFRHTCGESDYPKISALYQACSDYDGNHQLYTEETIANDFKHATMFIPERDTLVGEIGGEVIVFSEVFHWVEPVDGTRVYYTFGKIHPAWRRLGLGRAILRHNEAHARRLASDKPAGGSLVLQCAADHSETGANILYQQEGYQDIRRSYVMVRPDLDNIPDFPLPEGVEVRPVPPERIRQCWDAMQQNFSEHFGYCTPTEQDFQAWTQEIIFNPSLWQVAWQGDEVIGTVLNFIDANFNKVYHRKRGWTETISVRKDWRGRGLAKALIARSFAVHKAQGMAEVALNVDAQNTSGAVHLYESLGYQVEKTTSYYRKPF